MRTQAQSRPALHGRKRRTGCVAGKRSNDNPIIAVLRKSLQQGWRGDGRASTLLPNDVPSEFMRETIEIEFGDEAISEIGRRTIQALIEGDKRFVDVIRRAIKEAEHLFNRDRERVLLGPVQKFLRCVYQEKGARAFRDVARLKTEIEKHCNNGKPLEQHQWNRLRKALHLSKRSAGRHVNSDTEQP